MGKAGLRAADVAVIGAGIVGAACAYYLTRAGLRVAVLDRAHPCAGTSAACDGLLLLWDKRPGPELEFGRISLRLWKELAAELPREIEHEQKGSMVLADTGAALAGVSELAATMAAQGVAVEVLDGPVLHRLVPSLAPDLPGGAWFPDDAQVEPRRATMALLEAARAGGASVHRDSPIVAIERGRGGGIEGVRTPAGAIATPHVVIAAGAWSGEVASLVGATVPVRPRKGHLVVIERAPPLVRAPLLEAGYTATVGTGEAGVAVATVVEGTRSGTLLLGSSREFVGFDRTADARVIGAIAERAMRFLPALERLRAIRTYAGLRPYSPDHFPIVGPLPGIPGCYVATGHEGAGICLAAGTGRLIAQWITGAALDVPASWFDPGRFTAATPHGAS